MQTAAQGCADCGAEDAKENQATAGRRTPVNAGKFTDAGSTTSIMIGRWSDMAWFNTLTFSTCNVGDTRMWSMLRAGRQLGKVCRPCTGSRNGVRVSSQFISWLPEPQLKSPLSTT